MFLIARVFFGVAEGPNFPCATRAISDWLPEKERARAFTFSLIAVPLSLALGGLLIAYTIHQIGWRHCFFYLAAITLLWVPLWIKFFHNQPKHSPYLNSEELSHIEQHSVIKSQLNNQKSPWKDLLTNKTLMSNNLAFFVFGFYLNFFMNWLPSYFSQAHHIKFESLGLYNFLPWCCAAFLLWVVGTLSDYIFTKTQNLRYARTYPIIITQSIAALCMISIDFIHNFHLILLCITLGVGFAIGANAPFYAVNVDVAKERAGSALGIMSFGFSLAGILAPILTGYILNWTQSFDNVFYFMAFLSLASILNLFFMHNRPEKLPMSLPF
jgi:ACS family hexuronate transporter-like MFS transporter